jgi:AraC family transcriptional regulator
LEWLIRMKDAIDFMENTMTGKLNVEEIAKSVYSSPFHFQRMFHMLTGFTVAEYIRKRRLTLAAQELAVSSIKVLDVALKYGYESPESFSKAFRKAHGISPSDARAPGAQLKAFPRISFHLTLKGDKEMDYKIMDKDAFEVIGKSIQVTTKDGENFRRIPEFWQQCHSDGTTGGLLSLGGDHDLLGICLDMEHSKEQFTYMIAVEHTAPGPENGLTVRTVPASTWAVFASIGPMPGAIQDVWKRIFQEWFPATGYEHTGGPELEVYPQGNAGSDDYRCEVWIPVVKMN